MTARILILHAPGTNRDRQAALACTLAGGRPEIVHLNQLLSGERRLLEYAFLILPGGFSYGDDPGAGTLWGLALRQRFGEELQRFVDEGRPVLGIGNGFQALVRAGLLPGPRVTLAGNRSGHFECRWVHLRPEPAGRCLFTRGLQGLLYLPAAHAQGNLVPADEASLAALQAGGQVALTYVGADGRPAPYPANPNGSAGHVAGICNPAGNVLGLMPHPEGHILPHQHPRWTRGEAGGMGLALFEAGVRAAGRK